MNSISLDILFLRRPKLNYVSPPVCEALFSGTGSPIIILPEIGKLTGPTGLVLGGTGKITLSWNNYPGAICYNVYSAVFTGTIFSDCTQVLGFAQTAQYVLLAECVAGTSFTLAQAGCYRISAITGEGETDLSDPACTACYTPPCPFGSIWNPETFHCEACDFSTPCPGGFTQDEVLCQCVPCGTQHCDAGFLIDSQHPCNCIPCGTQICPTGTYRDLVHPCNCVHAGGPNPVEVCNEEQTSTCEPPEVGTPVTIPAGTFCTPVNPPTAENIAAAQADMNAAALAAAEAELQCCGPLPDWSQLSWGASNTLTCGSGSASFTPSSSASATFTAHSGTTAALSGASLAGNLGTLPTYTGPVAHCNLHLIISGTNLGNQGTDRAFGNITIRSNGFPVLSQNLQDLGVGTFDLPFSFSAPNCADSPQTVTVDVGLSTNTFGGPGGCAVAANSSITVTGTLSLT